MAKYQVDIPHSLPPEEAKKRLASATGKLEKDYGAACKWKSDNELSVSRKGLDAKVIVEPNRVHVEMDLGFLLTPFAERIKGGIAKQLAGILA
jgi:putative polyhydroxyalkanoate system protein